MLNRRHSETQCVQYPGGDVQGELSVQQVSIVKDNVPVDPFCLGRCQLACEKSVAAGLRPSFLPSVVTYWYGPSCNCFFCWSFKDLQRIMVTDMEDYTDQMMVATMAAAQDASPPVVPVPGKGVHG